MKLLIVTFLFLLSAIGQAQMARAPDSETATNTGGAELCYTHFAVKLIGAMNTRAKPSITSEKVDIAPAGSVFYVNDSIQGESYCWLLIGIDQWMAVTGFVAALPETEIIGPPGYKTFIERVLRLLEEKDPDAYRDVMLRARTIAADQVPPGETEDWKKRPQAFSPQDWIYMPIDGLLNEFKYALDTLAERRLFIAGVLVHETCHLKQYDEGRLCWRPINELEAECFATSVRVMTKIDRRSTATEMMRYGRDRVDLVYSTELRGC